MRRYWLGGPCEENGATVWLVIDGHSTPQNSIETIAFKGTEAECLADMEKRNAA